MNKRVFLVGLAGGLLVSGALFYPLFLYVPSNFVEGWSAVDSGPVWPLLALAGVLLLVTGFVAGRSSGTHNRVAAAGAGAAAGLTAALLAEILLGSAATAV
jgi:hypothetical protein